MRFRSVIFDVAGVCNARCAYCVTGAKSANPGAIMTADTFDAALHNLERLNLIDSRSVLELYNWGELFLHPDLQNVIRVINDHNLRYSISTNASVLPQIDEAFVKNLIAVKFSMCGFSQQSYDRIHKLEFDRIRENIATIVSRLRSLGYKGYIEICFHVYRWNTNELRECQRFAKDLGVVLLFLDAYLLDWWQFEGFIQGTLPDEKRRQILDDLFIDEKKLRSARTGWRCPEWNRLVIDERENVPVCCGLPNNHPAYSLGTVDDGLAKRLRNRPNLPICKTCLESGIGYRWFHPTFKGESSLTWMLRFTTTNWRVLWTRTKTDWRRFGAKQMLYNHIYAQAIRMFASSVSKVYQKCIKSLKKVGGNG
jgi:MoaA/NifB/PqqE/SkfB family radical SAM enzyme